MPMRYFELAGVGLSGGKAAGLAFFEVSGFLLSRISCRHRHLVAAVLRRQPIAAATPRLAGAGSGFNLKGEFSYPDNETPRLKVELRPVSSNPEEYAYEQGHGRRARKRQS
jgi:hypothetical protein